MIWPPTMLETIMTIIIGISTVPLWVALVPMTPWMNSGMNRIVPNMPIAISVRASTDDGDDAVAEQAERDDRLGGARLDQQEDDQHDRRERRTGRGSTGDVHG